MKQINRERHSPNHRGGYALIDLLTIIAVLALFSQILIPAMSRARSRNQALVCMQNTKRLMTAWQMYQDDNKHALIEVYHGSEALGGVAARDPRKSPWATGWLDWTTRSDNTNTVFLVDDSYSKFARYFGNNAKVVKCPTDNFVSPAQKVRGWKSRVRSYSINLGMGAGNAESGPWWTAYRHMRKLGDIADPSMTSVFIEENPDSMNDPGFFNPASPSSFLDQPASYHEGAANVSFSDGHTEIHQWKASLSHAPATHTRYLQSVTAKPVSGDEDIAWLSARGGLTNPNVWVGAPLR
jgi:prepilin-type processing-associated H-X9-DG protein